MELSPASPSPHPARIIGGGAILYEWKPMPLVTVFQQLHGLFSLESEGARVTSVLLSYNGQYKLPLPHILAYLRRAESQVGCMAEPLDIPPFRARVQALFPGTKTRNLGSLLRAGLESLSLAVS